MKEKKNILTQEMGLEFLKKDVKKYGYRVKEFSLTCSLPISLKRDKKRGGKTKLGTIRKIHKKFEKRQTTQHFLINTEKNSLQQTIKTILTEIRKTYKDC